jgi:hypothetical protein
MHLLHSLGEAREALPEGLYHIATKGRLGGWPVLIDELSQLVHFSG